MAATIKFKRGTTDPTQLNAGEPAFNTNAKKFYIGHGTNVQTWVGAEIENTVANWATASNEKLATQSAIYNQFIDKSRESQSITGHLSVYNFNAADIEVDTVGLKDKTDGAIGYYEGTGANRAFFEKIKFSGTASNPGPDGSSNSITANNTIIIGNEVWLPSTINVGGSKVVLFGGAGEDINIGKPATTSNNATRVNVGSIGFWSRTVAPGSIAMKPFYSVRLQGPTDTLSEDLVFTLPNSYPTGKGDGSGTRPLVSDASGNLSWGEFNSETTTFNIADSSDSSAELNLVLTDFNSGTAGQGSALIDTAAGTSGQDGGIKYNPSTNTLTTSVFRVREGTTAAYISIDAPQSTTSYEFTLPTTGGTPDYVLKTDGSGNTSWTDTIAKASTVHVTDTPGVLVNGVEEVFYPSFYADSSASASVFYATRVDEKAYEVKPTRNRFSLKTGELPVGISRWTTCSTGAGNCVGGAPPTVNTGGTTDTDGAGGSGSGSPGTPGFDTPSSADVGNFGVGELEFSARNITTDAETGYLRFSINPALTQHISYVLPDTLPTPGQFLAVGDTNFEQDSDLGDVRQLTWTTSAGQVNVADASEDSQYNAAYALTFAATTGGAGKGLLYDTHDNNSVGGLTWNPKTNVLRAGAIEFNTGILEDDANQGGTSYNTIDLGAVGASSKASDVNLFVQSTGIITIGDTAGAEVRVPTISAASNANAAATKAYVDAVAEGLHVHASTKYATTVNVAGTYSNGTNNDGIGATITATSSGQLVVDGNNVVLQDRILVKNQSNSAHNGIYVVTNTGAAGNYQLTRAEDFNTSAEVDGGDFVFVTDGAAQNKTGWVQTTRNVTIGSTSIVFSQFAGVGTYTAGNGVRIDGTVFGLTNSNNTDFLTLNNNGAIYSNGTGLLSGTLPVAAGGTNISSYATGDILYATGTTTLSKLAKPSTAGSYLLQMDENGTPSWQNRTGLSIENAEKVKVTTTESSGTYYLTYTTSATNNSYESVLESAKLTYNPSTTYIGQNNVAVLTVDGYVDAIIDGGTYN